MKRVWSALAPTLFLAPVSAEPPPEHVAWERTTELWFNPSSTRLYAYNVIYAQTHLDHPCVGWCREDEFQHVDVTRWGVPRNAKWVFLSGQMLITHGTTQEIADLKVVFRRPGDNSVTCEHHLGQSVEAQREGGQRTPLSTWVPLRDGALEWCFTTSTPGAWPEHAAYGVNLGLQAWAR